MPKHTGDMVNIDERKSYKGPTIPNSPPGNRVSPEGGHRNEAPSTDRGSKVIEGLIAGGRRLSSISGKITDRSKSSKQAKSPAGCINETQENGKEFTTDTDPINDYPKEKKKSQNKTRFKESLRMSVKSLLSRKEKSSKKKITFGPDVMDNENKVYAASPIRRASQACEFEADDEGFCIDGFNDDDESINSFSDEEDMKVSDEEDSDEEYNDEVDSAEITTQPRIIEESKVIPKYQRIAQEIMTTEKTYVQRLAMLHKSSLELQENKILTIEQCEQIFKNLEEIFQLHKNEFLPEITKRIENWDNLPRIGDIMKKFSPFFKLYTPFVKNIQNARDLIRQYRKTSTKFTSTLQKIESSAEAGRISLADYMTEPMTRLLRYKLLLGEYLRKLPEEHMDRVDIEAALDITSDAASYVNESIRAEDNMARLMQIKESLVDEPSIVDPNRIVLKEGRVALVDSLKARHLERHIFLFNDLILVCQPQMMGMKYKVHKRIPLKHITLDRDDDSHHFRVRSRKIVSEFYGSTQRETDEWMKAIGDALQKFREEHKSEDLDIPGSAEEEPGYCAPIPARRDSSGNCNLCGLNFVSIRRKKTHCLACGQLYCQKCTSQVVRLAYADWQMKRVCNRCYSALKDDAVCQSIENLKEDEWEYDDPPPPPKPKQRISASLPGRSLPKSSPRS